ncbi:MAG: indole-3-glycerol phosphate synthase TrpC [Proteobacteria bacterium]|nr:indole-3-glycerol phosphate synthase TrpC [Pseudomonadota bacterium]MBU1717185.1 indole-3-glycerol phosphate synthase TrpC [Pseudomonadota bacterium]
MILDKIVDRKKEEVTTLLRHGFSVPEGKIDPPRGFCRQLNVEHGIAVIAEAKKASPSKGVICPDFDPVAIAASYKAGGARAMSVLTDEDFFQGNIEYIPLVRRKVDLPVLRKDFIIHEVQIRQASAYGADAILLIAAILDPAQMRDFQEMAWGLGMDVLVEVHDEQEMDQAMAAGTRLLGVNNRNLRDFSVDLETTFRIKRLLPPGMPLVSESGIRDLDDLKKLAAAGVTAALIGETLMRAEDRAAALRSLLSELCP